MKWKLYYQNGKTFSDEDGDWLDAPARGVQVVISPNPEVGFTPSWNDFYIIAPWSNDQPWGVDQWGLMDYLIEIGVLRENQRLSELSYEDLVKAGVKLGRTIPTPEWREVIDQANNDPEVPKKSGRYRHERP